MDIDLAHFSLELVRRATDAIIYADHEGVIRFWNAGAARTFGFTEQEAQGFDRTMRTGESRYGAGDTLAVPAMRKDGARISVEFTIVPFRDDSGKMSGIAAILRDVSARFEQMKALQRELAELRAAKGS